MERHMHNIIIQKDTKSLKGFTLIEMAIVTLIVGLLLASFSPLYALYRSHLAETNTNQDITTITDALGAFRNINGRYPCPADATLPREHNDYGHEKCENMTAVADGNCVGGVCIERSVRAPVTYTDPFTGAVVTQAPRVYSGMVPFRKLNLQEEDVMDGYNNRVRYAVTYHMTSNKNYQPGTGGVEIINDKDVSNLDIPGAAEFVVFSAGRNDNGAYSRAGTLIPCDNTSFEGTNCNLDDKKAIYRLAQTSTSNDPSRAYDDVMSYFIRTSESLWQVGKETYDIYQKPSGAVAFANIANTAVKNQGDVSGIVRVDADAAKAAGTTGKIFAEKLCDVNDKSCFPAKAIAGVAYTGDDPDLLTDITQGMPCLTDGHAIKNINEAKAGCEPVRAGCPAGQYLRGIKADKTPDCVGAPPPPPIPCPATTKEICGVMKPLPESTGGNITLCGGANFCQKYQCTAGGTWEVSGPSTGECICTPGSSTYNIGCGSGFTGTATETETITCAPGRTYSYTQDRSACTCSPVINEWTEACPGDQIGSRTFSNNHICPADSSPPYWTGVIEDVLKNTCTCPVLPNDERSVTCPEFYSGTKTETWKYSCNPTTGAGTWTLLSTDDKCTCTGSVEKTKDCPAGYTGKIVEKFNVDCSKSPPALTFDQEIENTCQAQTCSWQPISSVLSIETEGAARTVNGTQGGCGNCSAAGDVKNCSQANGPNNHSFYNCLCK
jgi:prepilin-type N-terminal cleavage/methylation domain-containing protein